MQRLDTTADDFPADSSTRMTFASLHSESRSLEAECDRLLGEYSAFIETPSRETSLPQEISANLALRAPKLSTMEELAHKPHTSATVLHQYQRHKEITDEHIAQLKRLTDAIVAERNRQDLLSSVRYDIASHRQAALQNPEQYYSEESSQIDRSDSVADRLLRQALETRNEFMNQQQILANVQRRIFRAFGQMPSLNAVIGKINTRQKRNSLVLITVITLCIVMLVYFY